MDEIAALQVLSVLDWKKLTEENKKILLSAYKNFIIGGKSEDNEMVEVVNRVFRCGSRIAKDILPLLHILKISNSKLKAYVGK